MVEIISLLSSPEICLQQPASRPSTSERRSFGHGKDILSDILDDSLFDIEEVTNPPKRRRLSPSLDISSISPQPRPNARAVLSSLLADDSPQVGESYQFEGNQSCRFKDWDDEISDPDTRLSSGGRARVSYRGRDPKGSTDVIIIDNDSEDLEGNGILPNCFDPAPPSASRLAYSDRTSSLLVRLHDRREDSGKAVMKSKASISLSDEDSGLPRVARTRVKRPADSSASDKTAKALVREAAKFRREKEKAEEKERKRNLKEEKEKAKKFAADIAQANKLKINKKESTPEMLVDMSQSFEDSSVGTQVGEYMRHLGVQIRFVSTKIPNIVSWRRKITAFYNDEVGHWEPCPLKIRREEHVLCFLSAQEFVNLVVAPEVDQSVESHLRKLLRDYPGCKPIYLIEGLTAWMRKNQNVRNRAYQAAVRRQMVELGNSATESGPSNRRSKRAAPPEPPIDDDAIEDALLQLQVQHNCLIYHTAAAAESAEWIKNFTEHISTIPYRRERLNVQDAVFCMDSGQVKSGVDVDDTYIRMLEEIQRVTAPVAYGVAVEYSSVRDLVNGMREHGPLRLQDAQKCANKSGALTEARIGPAVSKRLHKIFTSLDPASTDI
ncbi:crossover junction endonuclease EME1 [Coccidioides immitis RS]|uniref:Crossover junction endonuclease EME1 n=3 Tax=Coccidioides immitis TaxID=5501 RepID=A0A0D8JTG3_COCIM|nr:crossover junction endonuclease EME1 [Coccidioides immitis RS]KJF60424.1 crossover junction endonuclease EME1 [Coccidioides immitis RS]KMP02684.1 hypothetical protein CIRG_02376 [Coccidioides immitis RMSCC 2394]KMU80896.1 hypothetical protein CISG_08792 [Coccidioides immitis RMSCC 3703]